MSKKTTSFFNILVETLRNDVVPSKEKLLVRRTIACQHGVTGRYEDTLDSYYVGLINDTLRLIRKRKTAYVFSVSHIRDILRFEPNAQFNYIESSNSIAVTLPSA